MPTTRRLGLLLLYGLGLLTIARPCWAQIVFKPDILTLEINDKENRVADVIVRNQGAEAKDITLGVEYRRRGPCQLDIQQWVSVYPDHLHLDKGEARNVRIQLHGWDTRIAGECVLSLFAGEWMRGQINLNLKTGMPVFVRLNHEKKICGRIIKLEGEYLTSGKLLISATVENNGVVHLLPYGISWIIDVKGTQYCQTEFRGQPVFSGETKVIQWQIKPAERKNDDTLGIRLFWGTAYGMEHDIPKSTEVKVPFKRLLKKKE